MIIVDKANHVMSFFFLYFILKEDYKRDFF